MTRHADGRPIIPDTREADLLGLEHILSGKEPDLVLFMAGNQFMVVPQLLELFQQKHPEVRRIFCETLPPRLELEQILTGGAWFRGQCIETTPDLYASVSDAGVPRLAQAGKTDLDRCFTYLHNRIALMVPAGNPASILAVEDMGRAGVLISQPNPEFEDIAEHITAMYRSAGGETLERRIMEEKREAGETLLTTVHHRETPERLISGQAHVGPVWATEIINARRQGLALDGVNLDPTLDQRDNVRYTLCPVSGGRNPENGAAFARFLASGEAQDIFRSHGFTPGCG